MRILFASILAFCFATVTVAAGEGDHKEKRGGAAPVNFNTNFTDEMAQKALASLSRSYELAVKHYHDSLTNARGAVARSGDVEEVKRIESALKGGEVIDFTSSSCKRARDYFDNAGKRAAKIFVASLKRSQKIVLGKGNAEEAENMNAIVVALEESLDLEEGIDKKVTVYADKDWQKSGVEVNAGDLVKFSASGKWSPGARKKVSKNKWEIIYGDPDTYNFQVRIQGMKNPRNGGKEWEAVAPNEGELEFRMVPMRWRARLGEAKGSISVRVTVDQTVSKSYVSIESLLNRLVPVKLVDEQKTVIEDKGGKASSTEASDKAEVESGAVKGHTVGEKAFSKEFALPAKTVWFDTLINVRKGAVVTIKAEGKWSIGQRRRIKHPRKEGEFKFTNKAVYASADKYKIEIMLENEVVDKAGSSWTFVAGKSGVLYLRMAEHKINGKPLEPDGDLKVTVYVEAPGSADK